MADKVLALFDFDGTLTHRDSLWSFLRFVRPGKFYILLLPELPNLLFALFGVIKRGEAKRRLIARFLKNMPVSVYEETCARFVKEKLPGMLRKEAMQRLNWHKVNGHEICLVSASLDGYLKPWSLAYFSNCLCTKLSAERGHLSGKFALPNCNGPEKARRIKALYNLEEFKEIHAYGNSGGDKEMLQLATHRYFRRFS